MSQKSRKPPFIRRGQIFWAHGERFEAHGNSRTKAATVVGLDESIVLAVGLDADTLWPEPTEIPVIEDDRFTFIEARKPRPAKQQPQLDPSTHVRPMPAPEQAAAPQPKIPTFYQDPEPVTFTPSAFAGEVGGTWAKVFRPA